LQRRIPTDNFLLHSDIQKISKLNSKFFGPEIFAGRTVVRTSKVWNRNFYTHEVT